MAFPVGARGPRVLPAQNVQGDPRDPDNRLQATRLSGNGTPGDPTVSTCLRGYQQGQPV